MGIQAIEIQGGLGIGNLSEQGIEAASQGWNPGAPIISSSGKMAQASNDPAIATVMGFSTAEASGTTNAPAPFIPARRGTLVVACIDDAQAGGNAPGTHALAQTDVFDAFGLEKDGASNNWYASAASSVVALRCIRLIDPIGTVQGRALFVLLS